MSYRPPKAVNEPVLSYAPGTPERAALREKLASMAGQRMEIASIVGGKDLRTGALAQAVMPHCHSHVLADVHMGGAEETRQAIQAAKWTWESWSRASCEERAAIFLRAAELLSGPWRSTINAATMLNQSKTAHQAEIDSACELADFWRFNVEYAARLYDEQPESSPGVWNRMEYRPLEGFVFAVTPFNFTSIAGNLPTAPALMGNTVIWKPASTAMYSAYWIMRLLSAAGLPDGVINLVFGRASEIGDTALANEGLAGVHFTGSTEVFHGMWRTIGERVESYRNYPRVVGETGGKDFILAHASADVDALVAAIIRGSFEYQGQKCSASSRIFVAEDIWPAVRERLVAETGTIRMGDVADFRNFMGAVIDRSAFERHRSAIEEARNTPGTHILAGGGTDGREGWFVEPTVVVTEDAGSRLLREELFGPITTVFVFRDFAETLRLIDTSTAYGLTGAIFATDRAAVGQAEGELRHAAGNFYVNDKPTGAVVGQQPFGGARASGTNDKAGSLWNLIRWVSPRTIKETFVPPKDYRYAFLDEDRP
ncbi:MAG TPA: L-glutamate gamma-semialdehyde dehydrogenase [Chloroflexota bacterium]|nr:L-glutamate gamma-semialdehyde dehydrogenase [Chloroflexota bacterium]